MNTIPRLGLWTLLLLPSGFQADLPGTAPAAQERAAEDGTGVVEQLGDAVIDALTSPFLGAGDGPQWDSLRSPRHSIMTFFEAMDRALEGDEAAWARALRTLPSGADGRARRAEAETLKVVMDRLGDPEPFLLPGVDSVRKHDTKRYGYFPHSRFAWVWSDLEEPPVGSIALARGPDGNWTFTEETLAGIGELEETTRALPPNHEPDSGGGSFDGLFGATVERTPLWGWGALFGCILGGVVAGYVARRLLRWCAAKTRERSWPMRSALAADLASPLHLMAITVGIAAGLRFVHLGATLQALAWGFFQFLILLAIGWTLVNLVDLVGELVRKYRSSRNRELDRMVISLFTKAARVFLIVALVIVLLQNILGVNITSFLAGLGIAGLALSLAAKDSLQNLLGGLTIFFDKPFQVGDVVRFNQSFGTVEDIGLRSTTIRMLNGDVVCQPNMAFVDQKVENVSLRPHIRREMNLTIPYDTPLDKIEEAIEIVKGVLHDDDVVAAGRFRMEDLPPRVSFNEFNDSSLNIRAYYWFHMEGRRDSGWYEYLDHCQKVNLAVFRKLTAAGIEIAFPTRTVFLAGDAKRPLDVGRNGGAREPSEDDAGERGDETAHAARVPARPSAARGRPLAYDPADEGADGGGADGGGER